MARRALLLVNRHARQAAALLDAAPRLLREAGLDVIEATTTHPRRLSTVVRRYRDRVDLVVIGGGDGTLNGAADGLAEAQLPLGVLPLGTANDLARTLGLPVDLAAACRVIAEGNTRRIDLGRVNDKHFFNVASIGLSTAIAQRLTREAKSRWGVLAYGATALRVLWQSRPFRAVIRTGHERFRVKTVQIAVGNGRYYGGGMLIAADAAIDDRRLDLYSIEVRRWWQVIALVPALRRGNLQPLSMVRTLRGEAFDVITRRPHPVNTDGELTTHTPALFRVVPDALAVFVPRPDPTAG
jgi:YegS/Rv2252/BmrU family lipid kinase